MNIVSLKKNRGFGLIEVVIACAIITGTTFTLIAAATKGIELSNRSVQQVQASFLLEEGAEAVKSIRDANWTNVSTLTLGTIYYLSFNTSTNVWSLTTTAPTAIDSFFTRTVVFSAVSRDSSDDIAQTGTVDARTKKVVVTVSWPANGTTVSKALTFYIADIFN